MGPHNKQNPEPGQISLEANKTIIPNPQRKNKFILTPSSPGASEFHTMPFEIPRIS